MARMTEIHPAPRIQLILGGARSGKSRHAEALIERLPPPWVYIATAQAHDDEMRARIAEHRARRPKGWTTIDAPLDLAAALAAAGDAPVLVDCLTLWLTNLMLGEHALPAATDQLTTALATRTAPTVLVASEVGLGIVPENALARRFRDAAGRLHQRIAGDADGVVLMVAGIPMRVK
jgi:adenosylcobinamide kinase / adenosylcobinamide-phosphate guanylyltransferase